MEPTPEAPAPPLHTTYLTDKQLAKELPKCSPRKLRTWRNLRIGPKWFRIGREVCYLRSSVDQWIRENEIAIERQQRQQRPARTARQRPRGAIAANLNRARQQRPKTDPESRLGREDEVNHSKSA